MKPELENILCNKYPKIFSKSEAGDDAMLTWGIGAGDGWFPVIDNGCSLIQSHIDYLRKTKARALKYNRMLARAIAGDNVGLMWHHSTKGIQNQWQKLAYLSDLENPRLLSVPELCDQVVATQIKEKFGTLRFYYSGGDDFTGGVIDMMEKMTETTCEDCGSIGTVTSNGGWLRNRCAACIIGFKQESYGYNPVFDYKGGDE